MFPMLGNFANFLTLLEKLADRSVMRELADEIETYLASEPIDITKKGGCRVRTNGRRGVRIGT